MTHYRHQLSLSLGFIEVSVGRNFKLLESCTSHLLHPLFSVVKDATNLEQKLSVKTNLLQSSSKLSITTFFLKFLSLKGKDSLYFFILYYTIKCLKTIYDAPAVKFRSKNLSLKNRRNISFSKEHFPIINVLELLSFSRI